MRMCFKLNFCLQAKTRWLCNQSPIPTSALFVTWFLPLGQSLRRHWNNWHQIVTNPCWRSIWGSLTQLEKPIFAQLVGKSIPGPKFWRKINTFNRAWSMLHDFSALLLDVMSLLPSTSWKDLLQHCEACHCDQIGISKSYHNFMHNRFIYSEMQVFNPWNLPTGNSSCYGRLQACTSQHTVHNSRAAKVDKILGVRTPASRHFRLPLWEARDMSPGNLDSSSYHTIKTHYT